MPVTPLHVGPALVIKAALGGRFSLLMFCLAQVMMDIEPVVRVARGDAVLHGWTHTYAGATLIGIACLFGGRPLCRYLLRRFQADPRSPLLVWLHGFDDISWVAAASGAFVGTWSHVLLDSIMHDDMQPLAPWSAANALHGWIGVDALQLACLASGAVGALLLAACFLGGRRARIS